MLVFIFINFFLVLSFGPPTNESWFCPWCAYNYMNLLTRVLFVLMKNLVWRLKMVFYVFMYLVMSYKIKKSFFDFSIMENNSILHQVKLWKITLSHSMLNKKSWKITFQFILKSLPTKQKTKIWKNLLLKKNSLFSKKNVNAETKALLSWEFF